MEEVSINVNGNLLPFTLEFLCYSGPLETRDKTMGEKKTAHNFMKECYDHKRWNFIEYFKKVFPEIMAQIAPFYERSCEVEYVKKEHNIQPILDQNITEKSLIYFNDTDLIFGHIIDQQEKKLPKIIIKPKIIKVRV
jgi:hypothetical protein